MTEAEKEKASKVSRSVFFAVAIAFFLAELGDKTMLATVTLATNNGWFGTWIGSTVGMVAADALAIGVGAMLGKHLPAPVGDGGQALAALASLVGRRSRSCSVTSRHRVSATHDESGLRRSRRAVSR